MVRKKKGNDQLLWGFNTNKQVHTLQQVHALRLQFYNKNGREMVRWTKVRPTLTGEVQTRINNGVLGS